MKFAINKEIAAALKSAATITRTRAVKPEDTAVLLEANSTLGTLYLYSQGDNGLVYEHTLSAEVTEDGSVAVPCGVLGKVLPFFDATSAETVNDGKRLRFLSETGKVDVPVFGTSIAKLERASSNRIELCATDFLFALGDVTSVARTADNRSYGNGMLTNVRVRLADGKVFLEGCRSTFTARISFEPGITGRSFDVNVPSELCQKALTMLKGIGGETMTLAYSPSTVTFERGGAAISASRMSGKFLNTETLYTPNNEMSASTIDVDRLKDVFDAANAVTPSIDSLSAVTLTIPAAGEGDAAKLRYDTELSNMDVSVACTTSLGASTSCSFIPRNASKALDGMSGSVTMWSSADSRPCIFAAVVAGEKYKFTQERLLLKTYKPKNAE